jgi:hypothetical protein
MHGTPHSVPDPSPGCHRIINGRPANERTRQRAAGRPTTPDVHHVLDGVFFAQVELDGEVRSEQAPAPTVGVDGRRGTVLDRNVELIVPAPSWVAAL